jgi:hypothetical protein
VGPDFMGGPGRPEGRPLPVPPQVSGQVLSSTSTSWKQVGYIKASNPAEGSQFGHAVAVSGDGSTVAVGAQMENNAAGAAYIYVRSGDRWTEQASIAASNADQGDQFGSSIALSADGNTLAVGAYFEDSAAKGINGNQADNSMNEAGAVYVFTRTGTTWSQQAYIKASNTGEPQDGDTFGASIALSDDGNTLAVGSPGEDSGSPGINGNQADNSALGAGAVYVFTRSGTTWSQQAYVKSAAPRTTGAGGDLFGYSVALNADGSTLAVGVFDEGGSSNVINGPVDNKLPGAGCVYVFTRKGGAWSQQAYLKASTQDRGDSLGAWVAVSDDGNTVVAGAIDEDSMTTGVNTVQSGHSGRVGAPDDLSSGAAYVFTRSGSTWSQQAALKASNTGKEDWFGVRLALSGDGNTLAVAAPNEDSASRGINGKQDDESAVEAGAVYVFTRSGATWTHRAYVKGSNTQEFDEFGSAVGLNRDGSLMAVGAKFEDSGARGVNGNEADNSVSDSGAAYVFVDSPVQKSSR